MTTNNTLPCNMTDSLTTLILAVVDSGINVTSQIESCPDLCGLSWGVGNPDFSGIGANFSWIVQASLSILLGPLLALGIYVENNVEFEEDDHRIEEVHKSFFQSLALVSLPVNLATLIYLRQTRFLFEVTFLYWLNTMQVLSLCSTVLTLGLFLNLGHESLKDDPKSSKDDAQISKKEAVQEERKTQAAIGGLCCIVSIVISLAVGGYIAKSSLAFPFLPELVDACGKYGTIVPKLPQNISAPPPSVDFWAWLGAPMDSVWEWVFRGMKGSPITFVFLLKSLVGLIATFSYGVLLALGWVLIVVVVLGAIRILWENLEDVIEGVAVVVPLLVTSIPVYILMPLGLSIGMLYCLVQMQIDRNSMRSILGENYIDDQWGFGQILSMFLWFQVTWGVCKWVYCVLINKLYRKAGSSNAKERSDDSTSFDKAKESEEGKGKSGDVVELKLQRRKSTLKDT